MPAKGHKPSEDTTWSGLAKRLRVSRQAINEWRKLPGAPTDADTESWKRFIEEQQLGGAGNKVGKRREQLLEEKVEKQNKLLDLQIAREESRMVPRAEVDQMLMTLATQQRSILYQKLENELPPKIDGLPIAESRAALRAAADEICDLMVTLIEKRGINSLVPSSPASPTVD